MYLLGIPGSRSVLFLYATACLAVAAIATVAASLLFAPLIERAILPRDPSMLALIVGAQFALLGIKGVTGGLANHLLARHSGALTAFLTRELHRALGRRPFAYFVEHGVGETLQLLRVDVAVVEGGASHFASHAVMASVQIVSVLAIMVWVDPLLFVIAFLGMAASVAFAVVAARSQDQRLGDEITANMALSQTLLDTLGTNGVILRTAADPDWIAGRVSGELERYTTALRHRRTEPAWFNEAGGAFGHASQAAFFFIAGLLVMDGATSLGTLVAFSALFAYLTGSSRQLADSWVALNDVRKRLNRILAVVGWPHDRHSPTDSTPPLSASAEDTEGDIVLEDVTVRYANAAAPALDGVSITVPSGKITAIVGPSGAGKSTLAFVLLGLVNPDRGGARMGSLDLAETSPENVWRLVGYVPQEPPFFQGSVRENLLLGRTGDVADLERACRAADVLDRILTDPRGFDAPMGEGGHRFSTGERQRLAIARALIARPRTLILDEPFANVDQAAEATLLGVVRRLSDNGATVILITHSPVAADAAHQVVRLDHGRVGKSGQQGEPTASRPLRVMENLS